MRNSVSRRTFFCVIGAAPLFAKEEWQGTKYTEWDEKTVQKLLTESPWAKKVTATGGPPAAGGPGGGAGGGRGGRGGGGIGGSGIADASSDRGMGGGDMGGGGRGGRGGGGGEMGGESGPRAPSLSVTVRWMSAMPMIQAMARRQKRDPIAHPEGYLIGVFGLPPQMAREGAEKFRDLLKANSQLKVKGRDPMAAEQVDLGVGADRTIAALVRFSAKTPISLDDKEVEFDSKLGPFEFKCKFKTKEMVVDGQLAV